MSFLRRIDSRARTEGTRLCVGLDPDLDRLPDHLPKSPKGVAEFVEGIVEATADLACVYKPNYAFFGALGIEGSSVLKRVIGTAQEHAPVILDAKVGDIGNTARAYARMVFEGFAADAVTLNPYMGSDSIAPFLEYEEKFAFILGITSNPSASDIETLSLENGDPVFIGTAKAFEKKFPLADRPNWGWVAGATQVEQARALRAVSPERWFLIPGVGAQGGGVEESLDAAKNPAGEPLAVINASRSILYASSGPDFKEAARAAAQSLVDEMRAVS